jgi:putative flavoprotein involved in K+ transport
MDRFDTVVVGGGQSGLAMGYYLKRQQRSFVILDQSERIGDSWRNRYDTLVLFTPRSFSDLPGLPFPGERDALPTKDDVADYLQTYAAHFQLPVELKTVVNRLESVSQGFLLDTNRGPILARRVVVATGPFHTPVIPAFQAQLAEDVVQLHTSRYRNERQLQDGPVLVVGSGNSGVQLAVELAVNRQVILSLGQARPFLPLTIMGKNIFWYLKKLGFLSVSISTPLGRWLSRRPDPIFGYKREWKQLQKEGRLRLEGRTVSVKGHTVTFASGQSADVRNVIWATGFALDYRWIQVPDAVNEAGKPIHRRGVSPVKGLYFLGLPWQYRRSSALLGGVGEDAGYLAEQINRESV